MQLFSLSYMFSLPIKVSQVSFDLIYLSILVYVYLISFISYVFDVEFINFCWYVGRSHLPFYGHFQTPPPPPSKLFRVQGVQKIALYTFFLFVYMDYDVINLHIGQYLLNAMY